MSKSLDRITLLETFVRIAETGSISAAARDLGLSQPSASRQLADLESRLKVQLMRRTTHSLALTDAGVGLLADARQLLDGWEALEDKHLDEGNSLRGNLKIIAPIALGQGALARIAYEFQHQHPGIALTWELEDRPIRFSESGCDAWIRVGPIPDDTLVVHKLGRVERLLVAVPAVVGSNTSKPKDAEQLPLVALQPFEDGRVRLRHRNGREALIQPLVNFRTNNIVALKEAVMAGLGCAVMPRWFVNAELEKGELIDVLPAWRAPALELNVACPAARHQTRRLRAFLDHLRQSVAAIDGINAPG